MPDLSIPRSSRYKDTPMFRNGKQIEFGLYQPPDEFLDPRDDNFRIHVVMSNEVGALDLIAKRYYGPGMETLWWAIAQANDIVDSEADVEPGQRLLIPSADRMDGFTSRDARERI